MGTLPPAPLFPKSPQSTNSPGIFLASAPAVQWNDFLLADGRFAHRARIPVAVHPLVYARPAKQVPAHADDRVLGRVQADVALEHRVVLLLFAVLAAVAVVGGGIFEIDFGLATSRRRGTGTGRR